MHGFYLFHLSILRVGVQQQIIRSRGNILLGEIESEITPPSPPGAADTEDFSLTNLGNLGHFLRRELNKFSIGLDTFCCHALRYHCGKNPD